MATIKSFERMLKSQTPWGASELDQRARRLREAGVLPSAGRGRHAPHLTAEHGAAIILSLASITAVDAVPTAAAYAELPAADGSPLGVALENILCDPAEAAKVDRLVINKSWRRAEIVFLDGRTVVFEQPDARRFPAYELIVINGSILSCCSLPRTVGGWTGKGGDTLEGMMA